jgi:hypothetical protein
MEVLLEHNWKQKTIEKLLAGKYIDDGTHSVAIFTPVNPGAKQYKNFDKDYTTYSDIENYRNEKKFIRFLREKDYKYVKVHGIFRGEQEVSFIVKNIPQDEVERICKETYQDSYIYADVNNGRVSDISFYQTLGVHENGTVAEYIKRSSANKSEIFKTPNEDSDEYFTKIGKKSWKSEFPHFEKDANDDNSWRKEYMKENTNPLKEGDVGGAVCTADGCIGDFAPEHICSVVTDITPTRKKIDEFFDKLDANMKALKEGKAPEKIDYDSDFDDIAWKEAHLRKFEYPGTVRYPGDEEYNKLKAEWAEKRKPIHDKKVVEPLNRYPNHTHSIGAPDMHSKYDDGREDDFLAWYEDHKKEVTKPQLKEKGKKMKESFEDANSDLYIVVATNPESEVCARLNDWYADLHGWVDNDDAFTIRADEISDIIDDFGKDELEIYECPLDIAESEEPDFYLSRSELNETSRF